MSLELDSCSARAGIIALALMLLVPISEVVAHGEKFQQADLRVRSIQWYDTEISRSSAEINDAVTLKGKFYVSTNWPDALSKSPRVFLHTGATEPALLRLGTKINGLRQVAPVSLELGGHYEYEMALKARVPGRSHIHPVLHIDDAGPLIGPGKWIEVGGNAADFNYIAQASSTAGFVVPSINPAQPEGVVIAPLAKPRRTVDAKVEQAAYVTPARSLRMQIKVTNNTNMPLRLGEVSSSYARFINPDVLANIMRDDPDEAIARSGLIVEGGEIAPGENRTLYVRAEDLIWEAERLSKFGEDGDGQFAALMHFYGPTGVRVLSEITGTLQPAD